MPYFDPYVENHVDHIQDGTSRQQLFQTYGINSLCHEPYTSSSGSSIRAGEHRPGAPPPGTAAAALQNENKTAMKSFHCRFIFHSGVPARQQQSAVPSTPRHMT